MQQNGTTVPHQFSGTRSDRGLLCQTKLVEPIRKHVRPVFLQPTGACNTITSAMTLCAPVCGMTRTELEYSHAGTDPA